MDKKPSPSNTTASSISDESQKRKADDKNTTKKETGQSSSKKPKHELDESDIEFLLGSARQQTEAHHTEVYDDRRCRYMEIDEIYYGNKTWGVGGYTIDLVKKKCKRGENCEWYCDKCRVCAHQFKCECDDGKYLCVHVHFLCEYERPEIEEYSDSEFSDDADESEEQKEEETNKMSTTFSECKSLLNDKIAEEILQENLDRALVQLQAHGQKLKKEAN